MSNIGNFSVQGIAGETVDLAQYTGSVVLVVNVASQCGFTPQYEGLQALYEQYKDRGLVVLGFPCNQFGAQEPGSEAEILDFCTTKFNVSFPLFAKLDVNGENASPLFTWLKEEKPGLLGIEAVKWNFSKFLLDKQGKVVDRFAPMTKPEDLSAEIEKLL
ncbi:glutathione peroxidase [Janthinobacterium sp. B9-8]|uniref:glutathione peroxidase n=1 Tax=Janthinobacterium sp. B9-8 TaxID=1236179 RepID=UPI00061D20C5|nr:glutathione peroxidase [Janthinobacterium sp. B9-8]AMC35495.1 glutathione peroxidase [Janthinobacterium sp. B9-8]